MADYGPLPEGGYWRTTKDDQKIYIHGGKIVAGMGTQAGHGPIAKVNSDGSVTTKRGVTIHLHGEPKVTEAPSAAPKDVEANFHKRRDAILPIIAKHHGITAEEAKANLQKAAENVVKGAEVWIRAPHTAVPKIVAAGRFKTQVETGKSGGSLDPEMRIDFEERLFGTPKDAEPEERPIYGYLEKNPNGYEPKGSSAFPAGDPDHRYSEDHVKMYGNVAFRLKPDVKSRTTFIGNDSLEDNGRYLHSKASDGVGNARSLPSLVTKPSGVSLRHAHVTLSDEEDAHEAVKDAEKGNPYPARLNPAALGKGSSYDHIGRYAEAQVHGGVKLSDVAEAAFYDEKHFKAHKAKLAKVGIPSRYVANPHTED